MVTSLPDVTEARLVKAGRPAPGVPNPDSAALGDWQAWFVGTAALILSRLPDDSAAIFYQTDIKRGGAWIDKGYLVQRGAEQAGARLLWHKVVCRKPPGTVTFGRPAWAHLLAFSRGLTESPGDATADVLAEPGEMTWSRAIPLAACQLACRWIAAHTHAHTVVDPFCGVGTALAVANAMGLSAVGVELSRRRAAKARTLQLRLK